MINLYGHAPYYRAERLEGDVKHGAYADAATRFAHARANVTAETQRSLWVEIGSGKP